MPRGRRSPILKPDKRPLTEGRNRGGKIAVTIEDLQNNEVLRWREKPLVTMGFDPEQASESARTILALYELEHLLERGCRTTAVAILR
jgi:hypothetical protein